MGTAPRTSTITKVAGVGSRSEGAVRSTGMAVGTQGLAEGEKKEPDNLVQTMAMGVGEKGGAGGPGGWRAPTGVFPKARVKRTHKYNSLTCTTPGRSPLFMGISSTPKRKHNRLDKNGQNSIGSAETVKKALGVGGGTGEKKKGEPEGLPRPGIVTG